MFDSKRFVTITTAIVALTMSFPEDVSATPQLRQVNEVSQANSTSEFCWRNSYGRGIGTIPQACAAGEDRIGLLCYPKCPVNTVRVGFDCHSTCPAGFRDDGLFCRLAEYGRGGGYAWQFGDPLNDSGMYRRCEADNGAGNCEKNGLIVYPKCKPGYSAFGCCICRPNAPNCAALGLGGQVDLSCAKKVIIGSPRIGQCGSDEDSNGGLCYKKCTTNYKGVGPVCWGQPPNGWVECGMGAAKDSVTCAKIIGDQVMSVGSLALNIATLGSSSTASAASKADPSKLAALQNAWNAIKDKPVVKAAEATFDAASKASKGYKSVSQLMVAETEADYVRLAATIASILDPTGVAGVIAAYSYDKCDRVSA